VSDDHRKLHELATVLEQVKETTSVANKFFDDYKEEILKKAAKKSLTKNISDLTEALSGSAFQDIVLACEQKELIQSSFKRNLLDTSSTRTIDMKATELVSEMQSIVSFRPDCLDTFLCVLTQHGGIPGITVAEAIAKDYGHTLPNYYERSLPTPAGMINHYKLSLKLLPCIYTMIVIIIIIFSI
jgi:hypothetical protein